MLDGAPPKPRFRIELSEENYERMASLYCSFMRKRIRNIIEDLEQKEIKRKEELEKELLSEQELSSNMSPR